MKLDCAFTLIKLVVHGYLFNDQLDDWVYTTLLLKIDLLNRNMIWILILSFRNKLILFIVIKFEISCLKHLPEASWPKFFHNLIMLVKVRLDSKALQLLSPLLQRLLLQRNQENRERILKEEYSTKIITMHLCKLVAY